jgi:hypothetical protein
VPERLRPWCEEVSEAQVSALDEAGYHVEGSLDDLRCRDSAFAPDADTGPSEGELSSSAVAALVHVVAQRARTRRRRGQQRPARGIVARVRRAVARRGGASWSGADEP